MPTIVAYVITMTYLYFNQESLLYHPEEFSKKHVAHFADKHNLTLKEFTAYDGLPLSFLYKEPHEKQKVILFFSGNAMNFSESYHKLLPFIQEGYGVAINIYRGYDLNAGNPSQQNWYNDAESIFRTLQSYGYSTSDIISYGYSIGSASAVYLASQHKGFHALIVESGFDSILNVAKGKYPIFPVESLLHDPFPSESYIPDVHIPKLHMHGNDDPVVSHKHGVALYSKAPQPKKFVLFEGGSHSLNTYDTIFTFLKKL